MDQFRRGPITAAHIHIGIGGRAAAQFHGIDANPGNQTLLRTLCTVGHSIGVIVIAESVRTEGEWDALKELGADGATGPGISYQKSTD